MSSNFHGHRPVNSLRKYVLPRAAPHTETNPTTEVVERRHPTNATNRERSRRMVWMPEWEGRDGDTEEAAGHCEGQMRDILWD